MTRRKSADYRRFFFVGREAPMYRFKKYLRKNSTQAEIIILLMGILMAVTNIPVVKDIGGSLIASAIVVFMTEALIGRDEDASVSNWGLAHVYNTRGEMNKSCDVYMAKAKSVDVIAFGLKSWRDSQQKEIENILKNGGRIRILTMVPKCETLKARERDENVIEGEIGHQIENLITWADAENQKGYSGRIEVRCHDHLPSDFMFLMDNRLFTGPYEYGKGSQQTISFEYSSSGDAYKYYKDYFERLWKDPAFCRKVSGEG